MTLNEIGSEGWELISVTPQSKVTNNFWTSTTTDQLWVFKRPVE